MHMRLIRINHVNWAERQAFCCKHGKCELKRLCLSQNKILSKRESKTTLGVKEQVITMIT